MTDVNELVEIYVRIRNARDALLKDYEAKDKELKTDLDQIGVTLLVACNEAGADSIKTESGTVIKRLNERYYPVDWEVFKGFVKENDALDLFEKRIHQGNIKELMSSRPDEGLPPGINVLREYAVTVRKSNSVKE